jgi:uncharacterized protein
MKIFYYFGHPAQFHFNRNCINILKNDGHEIFIYIKSKDVLETLIKNSGYKYTNVLPNERRMSFFGILKSLLTREFRLAYEIKRFKPDLLISSDPSFSQLGSLFGIPCINFIDDDIDVLGCYSTLTYPFAKHIVTPSCVRIGRYGRKRIRYEGYMKLAYLHPNQFIPDEKKIGSMNGKFFFLIRLSKLCAYHDTDAVGINETTLDAIIDKLKSNGDILISSEQDINNKYNCYKLDIPKEDIHHYLYYAQMLICDSQSMAGEASMLGVPSIRINTFVGKLSVLEELEHRYHLTFGISPNEVEKILDKIDEILSLPDMKKSFQERRYKMLSDKIDVTKFIVWLIEKYPFSIKIMKENPDYQERFK